MRRLTVIALGTVLALSVTACGARGASPSPPPAPAAAGTTVAPSTAPAQTNLLVGYCCDVPELVAVLIAQRDKIFEREGVHVELKQFLQGTATTLQALASGQIDVAFQGGSAIDSFRAAKAGAKIKLIATHVKLQPFWIYGNSSLPSVSALKGKRVVFGGLGGPAWLYAAIMIGAGGLTPSDVTVIQNGNDSQRLGLLLSGQADAAILEVPNNFRAEAKGYKQLVSLSDVVPSFIAVTSASDAAITQKRAAVQAFLDGYREGLAYMKAHVDDASRVWAELTKSDPEEARKSIDVSLDTLSADLKEQDIAAEFATAAKGGVWKEPLPSASEIDRYADYSFVGH